jgi:hypothetical protein
VLFQKPPDLIVVRFSQLIDHILFHILPLKS